MYKATENVALMLNVNTGRPLQAQLFEQVRAMIIDGQLTSGAALPATRALSEQLGVSRNTVVLAYDRLLAEGYIESKRSIGTFVSEVMSPEARSDEVKLGKVKSVGGLKYKKANSPRAKSQNLADGNNITNGKTSRSELQKPVDENFSPNPANSLLVPFPVAQLHENDSPDTHSDAVAHSSDAAAHSDDLAAGLLPDFAGMDANLYPDHSHAEALEVDFTPGLFDVELFPIRTWRRIINRKLLQIEDYTHALPDHQGLFELRRAIAEHLGPGRGIITSPDEVVIVSNPQEARALLCQILLKEGAPAIMESPGHEGVLELFSYHKAKIYGVGVDDHGLLCDDLPELDAERSALGLSYVTPSHQFPFGVSLALPRRIQLLEWAYKTNMIVVEDESTCDFRYGSSPLTALKVLDSHQNVVYLGGFLKTLGVQIGYLVVPPALVQPLKRLKALAHPGPSWLEQAAMAEFIDNGAYDRHLRKLRKKCMEKRDLLIKQLKDHFGEVSLSAVKGGLHLIWHLPTEFGTAENVIAVMQQKYKIGLYTVRSGGSAVVAEKDYKSQALIFGYSSLSLTEIEDAIAKLAAELKNFKLGKR